MGGDLWRRRIRGCRVAGMSMRSAEGVDALAAVVATPLPGDGGPRRVATVAAAARVAVPRWGEGVGVSAGVSGPGWRGPARRGG